MFGLYKQSDFISLYVCYSVQAAEKCQMQKFVTMKKKSSSNGSLASHSSLMSHLQSLATAIAGTKVLSAQQVIKNEAGEEVLGYLNILSVKNIRIWKCKLKFNYEFFCFLNNIVFRFIFL